jgi:hypothetical protein
MFKSIMQSGMAVGFLSMSMLAFADNIICPDAELIKQSGTKLDHSVINPTMPGTYTVITSATAFDDSNKQWVVGVSPVPAKDENEAILAAKQTVLDANTLHKYAYVIGNYYVCRYRSNIMTLASIDNNQTPSVNDFLL